MTLTKRQKAIRKRIREQRSRSAAAICPTPTKSPLSKGQAVGLALKRSKVSGKAMGIYRCQCGKHHITSKPNRKK
jgi:uncharacterized cupin superfamily protein